MREVYVWDPDQKKLVPKGQRKGASAPFVISDSMDATWHPADGKTYESKSAFRRVTRAAGFEEVGNERQKDSRRYDRVTKDDVKRAIEMVRQGYRPRVLSERLD